MSERMGSPPAIEDQARLLEDALVMVRQQTHLMRKCLETPGKLMDALKCRQVSRFDDSCARKHLVLYADDYPVQAPHWCQSFERAA